MRIAALVLLAFSVVACDLPTRTVEPAPTSTIDQTGILIVSAAELVQSGPVTRRFADPLEQALGLAETNGEDLGYPWFDPGTGELVLSVVTPTGAQLVEDMALTVPHRIREVTHGAGELQRIQDDVTLLGQRGAGDAELIVMTLPDHRDNRALIVVTTFSRSLLDELAAAYPPDAIAVQIDPDLEGA